MNNDTDLRNVTHMNNNDTHINNDIVMNFDTDMTTNHNQVDTEMVLCSTAIFPVSILLL